MEVPRGNRKKESEKRAGHQNPEYDRDTKPGRQHACKGPASISSDEELACLPPVRIGRVPALRQPVKKGCEAHNRQVACIKHNPQPLQVPTDVEEGEWNLLLNIKFCRVRSLFILIKPVRNSHHQ